MTPRPTRPPGERDGSDGRDLWISYAIASFLLLVAMMIALLVV